MSFAQRTWLFFLWLLLVSYPTQPIFTVFLLEWILKDNFHLLSILKIDFRTLCWLDAWKETLDFLDKLDFFLHQIFLFSASITICQRSMFGFLHRPEPRPSIISAFQPLHIHIGNTLWKIHIRKFTLEKFTLENTPYRPEPSIIPLLHYSTSTLKIHFEKYRLENTLLKKENTFENNYGVNILVTYLYKTLTFDYN